jgi:hypothetical protein
MMEERLLRTVAMELLFGRIEEEQDALMEMVAVLLEVNMK